VIYNPDQIKHTLSTILHTQGDEVAAGILDSARAEVSFVEADSNVDVYRLDLRIPAVRFAQIEHSPKQVERLQEKIRDKLFKLGVDPDGSALSWVRILPELTVGPGAASIALPTQTDESRIWEPNRLRLFLSHVSRIKEETSALKGALRPLGIDGFVAHDDIEPAQEWHREIEFALRSMHAFCAVVTNDYNASKWCDQEVGYALGRAVPVVLFSSGETPYGLMGKQQAVRGKLSDPADAAGRIFDVLVKQDQLTTALTEGLVRSLVDAPSFASAKGSTKRIADVEKNLSKEQVLRLLVAARDNSQVREATGVPYQIGLIAKRAEVTLPAKKAVADFDDDIPF
jgi:hypothetical protein